MISEDAFLSQNISLDERQKELLSKFKEIEQRVKARYRSGSNIFSSIKKLFPSNKISTKTSPETSNIYIYGGVGRGKTMIMKGFYEELPDPKLFVHYQNFMKSIHEDIHHSKHSEMKDVLLNVAKRISKNHKYICIDEFEVNDIADAMIIARLFEVLINYGVGIAITSNKKPEDLYKNGLQREQFLPFIDTLKRAFIIFELDTNHDYRLDKIDSLEERVLFPISKEVLKKIQNVKNNLTDGERYIPRKLEVFGRELLLPKAHKSVLVTNFDDICRKNLSFNDFIAIAKNFNTIIMENVPIINEDETDTVIRFINFIDNVYFHKVLLFVSLIDEPAKIYVKGKRLSEFQRTISRLYEIGSHEYLINSKGG